MKVTLWPDEIVTDEGVTTPLAMVIVAPLGPGLPVMPDEEVGELLPHAASPRSAATENA